MKLKDLASIIKVPTAYQEIEFTGISNDTRKIAPGELFIAIPGFKFDGSLFLDEARQRGAVAALVEAEADLTGDLPLIPVKAIRQIQGQIASLFYGEPSRNLRLIGVTGTNGKTTVTHLIAHLLKANGQKVGLIGTVWVNDGFGIEPAVHTTPDAIELQQILARMVANGVQVAVMEVSSHALFLSRVAGIEFDVAVLTNITWDHFDFHHNYQNYLAAKSLLFQELKPGWKQPKYAVVNWEDPAAGKIAANCRVPVFFYGFATEASFKVEQVLNQGRQSRITLDLAGAKVKVATDLPGKFNVYNILAAVTVAYQEGIRLEQIAGAIPDFPGVPGRYQEINCGQPYRAMVDFAHNPAALENILKMAKEYTSGRRIIVFGCEGEKDRLKRPLMGKIAVQNSEVTILTSDNLYHEEINQIFNDILADLSPAEQRRLIIEPNRFKAIKKAVQIAQSGDFLILAGKGHEKFLIKGSKRIKFDDAQTLQDILNNTPFIPNNISNDGPLVLS